MGNLFTQKEMRYIGVYLVVILALVRFLIYPLQASVDGGKKVLAEQYDGYQLKTRLSERQILEKKGQEHVTKTPSMDKLSVLSRVYDKGVRFSHIQADIVESLVKIAEKKGMMVLDFELLEPATGRNYSEVPVLIRISGQPGAFIAVLREIEQSVHVLSVKSMEVNRIGTDFRFFATLSAFRTE